MAALIRNDKRRPAIARAVEQLVRADHRDPLMADIAVHTLDLDRLATELAHRADYTAWADRLAPAVTAPPPTTAGDHSPPGERHTTGHPEQRSRRPTDIARRLPSGQQAIARWRRIWNATKHLHAATGEAAAQHGISLRTLQFIRAAGEQGHLDPPDTH